jgi:hypothetical protein
MQAYRKLVDEALIEVDEMRLTIEYESDGDPSAIVFLQPMAADLKRLAEAMDTDSYDFSDQDLPLVTCMEKHYYDKLPFKYLLDMINETHRKGLGTDDD